MRVLLVDADSKAGFPNLVLMKLSAYYKSIGAAVDLLKGIPSCSPLEEPDLVFISVIFEKNRAHVLDYEKQFRCPVRIGGSGFNLASELSYEIEHMMPDYALYGVDFSMGFTSRGCVRHCGFCIVPEKEGLIRDNAPIAEFWNPEHSKLILLDNNFGASPRWRENAEYIQQYGLKVNFNQGLDIRLMTEEFAGVLADLRYYNWRFKTRGLYFAFDSMNVEDAVVHGVDLLSGAGIPRRHLMFYILAGYDTTEQEDLCRIEIVKGLGAIPYVMPYNGAHIPAARWANRRYYQFVPYSDYMRVADKQ